MPFFNFERKVLLMQMMQTRKFYLIALVLFLLAFSGISGKAQAQGPQYIYRVGFTDKAGSPALSNPAAFLSARALSRRARLGIAVADDDRPVSPLYTDTTLQLTGGILHTASRWRNEITILLSDTLGLAALRAKSWVSAVEPVGYYPGGLHLKTTPVPAGQNPTLPPNRFLKTTANAAYYGATWTQTQLVNGQALHDAGYTGSGMLIAVIDEQFRGAENHPGYAALRQSGRLVDTFNFILRSTTGLYSGSSHGNSVLSDIAGYEPNTFVGAAPDASIAMYVSETQGSEQRVELDQMISAMERADSLGADIISASLGYNTFDFPAGSDFSFSQLDGKTTSVARAANLATAKGMLVVVAAGNEGNGPWRMLLTPGDADSALTVGSVASNGTPSGFSGYGPNAAGRVKPDVCGMGQDAAVYNTSGGYFIGSGTSYATPQLAGFAACLWQAVPNKRPGEIREAIVRSAHRYTTPDAQLGYGIPNFAQALQALGVPATKPPISGNLTAFYNPVNNHIFLFGDTGAVELSLYDLSGRKIREDKVRFSGNNVVEWSPEASLVGGMYLLYYQTNSGKGALKIVVP